MPFVSVGWFNFGGRGAAGGGGSGDGSSGGGGWFNFGGRGGGGGGASGSKPSLSYAIASEEERSTWDSHGLPAKVPIALNKLSGLKRYKVSEILFFDRNRKVTVEGTEDSFFEMVSIRPGGIYNKALLQKEVETLATCGMFEKVDLVANAKPDGTIGVTVSFVESTWQSADSFRCINVGLLPQTKPLEMDPDMTDKELMAYYSALENDYEYGDLSNTCPLTI